MQSPLRSKTSILSLVVIVSLLLIETSALAKRVTLEAGTRVLLRLAQPISSETAQVGQPISFEIIEDIRMGNTLLIQRGALAIGTITQAHSKKIFGRSGNLSFRLDYATALDGSKVPLTVSKGNAVQVKQKLGAGSSMPGSALALGGAVMYNNPAGMVISALSFFKKGKDVGLPAGQLIDAYVAQNTTVSDSRPALRSGRADGRVSPNAGTSRRGIQSARRTIRRRR